MNETALLESLVKIHQLQESRDDIIEEIMQAYCRDHDYPDSQLCSWSMRRNKLRLECFDVSSGEREHFIITMTLNDVRAYYHKAQHYLRQRYTQQQLELMNTYDSVFGAVFNTPN